MDSINVTVTGGTDPQRELVSNVISRSLNDTGFSNVALVNTKGEPMAAYEVPSLLGHIQERNPDFLKQPVRVWAIPSSETHDYEPLGDLEDGVRAKAVVATEDDVKFTLVSVVEGDLEKAAGHSNSGTDVDFDELDRMMADNRAKQEKAVVRGVVKEAARIALNEGAQLGAAQIERAVKNHLETEDLVTAAGL